MASIASDHVIQQYIDGTLKLTFTDLHIHTEYSLQDGMIRVADTKDPKKVKKDIILNAERRNTGAVTATDHGNMYGQAVLAGVAKAFDLKHIPGCEFYLATDSRHDKSYTRRGEAYCHINAWAKNYDGYSNMCVMQKLSFTEGFYYVPRIDRELMDKYGDNIMWSDACVGGIISQFITDNRPERAYAEFMWMLNRFKDDFYVEYHNHGMPAEDMVNKIKVEWADKHGVPVIAATDAHFYNKEDAGAHRTLLCIQYGNWADNPAFSGFDGDGYWLMDTEELLHRYPVEYLNNTQLVVDKVDGGIIKFGDIIPPKFEVPEWFVNASRDMLL